MEIKIELIKLKKSQRDLLDELNKRGVLAYAPKLSQAISGADVSPKAKNLLEESEKIIEEWKSEQV